MISEKEREFLVYWEKNRDRKSSFLHKLVGGLPMALKFGLPIILFIIVIRIFFPNWYMKISNISGGAFIAVIIAVFCLVIFYSWFGMQYKWEMNEQLYDELKAKDKTKENLPSQLNDNL